MAEVERTGGNGGIYAVLIIIVVLIVGIALYFSGVIGGRNTTPDIEMNIEVPAGGTGDGGGGGTGGTGGGGGGTGGGV